jgi:hypothetical protein
MCKFKVFILFLFVVSVGLVSCQEYSPIIKPSGELARNVSKAVAMLGNGIPKGMSHMDDISGYKAYDTYRDPVKVSKMSNAEKERLFTNMVLVDSDGTVVFSSLYVLRPGYDAHLAWLKDVEKVLIANGWEEHSVMDNRGLWAYFFGSYYAVFSMNPDGPNVSFMFEQEFMRNF